MPSNSSCSLPMGGAYMPSKCNTAWHKLSLNEIENSLRDFLKTFLENWYQHANWYSDPLNSYLIQISNWNVAILVFQYKLD